jgi:ABC-2 type transport system ATP-binding protein
LRVPSGGTVDVAQEAPMSRVRLALLLALLAACHEEIAGPPAATAPDAPARAVQAAAEDEGPPPPHRFGRDFYSIHRFTGRGITRPGLTCQQRSDTVRECTGYLASAVDGTRLDVTLTLPGSSTPTPLVVLIHGYAGSKTSSGEQVQPMLDEGFAVLRYSTRGFGDSWGQVNMVDTHAEVADLRSMIAQVVDDERFRLNPDAVAVTGASYGGGHAWLAALRPTFTSPGGQAVRIRTVVPIATWSDLLYGLIPNGKERESIHHPGGAKFSFINGLYLSGIRKNPARLHPNYPEYFMGWHAWINAQEPNTVDPVYRSIVDGLAGYRSIWWQRSFWGQVAREPLPIFTVQGFTDDLFPMSEAKRMILALQRDNPGYPVAAYFGDIGHPRARNQEAEVKYALELIRKWLAYHLKGTGTPLTGVYASRTDIPFNSENVIWVPSLPALATDADSAVFDGPPATLVNPVTDPAGGFFWDPLVMAGAEQLEPLKVPPPESYVVPGSLAFYDVPVSELRTDGFMIAGQPIVRLKAVTAAYRVQLNVRLYDVVGVEKRLITRGTYTLQSAGEGLSIGEVDVSIPTYGNLWHAKEGHTLHLELTNVDSPYITPSRVPSTTIVTEVKLVLPMRQPPASASTS